MKGVVLELGDVRLLGYLDGADGVAAKDVRLETNEALQARQDRGRSVETEAVSVAGGRACVSD